MTQRCRAVGAPVRYFWWEAKVRLRAGRIYGLAIRESMGFSGYNRTLRLATMPSAGLPAHLKRKDWVLMPTGKSPLHSDVDMDVSAGGYCFFQLVNDCKRP